MTTLTQQFPTAKKPNKTVNVATKILGSIGLIGLFALALMVVIAALTVA